MKESIENQILTKLTIISKLLAFNILNDKKISEQISILKGLGFRPYEIAEITGKTENQVNVTLSMLKKQYATKKERNDE